VRVVRAIGWVFVAAIGYHALLAANDARGAGADRSWAALAGYGTVAAAGGALVIGACVHALHRARHRKRVREHHGFVSTEPLD
jgi:hypothetical protein